MFRRTEIRRTENGKKINPDEKQGETIEGETVEIEGETVEGPEANFKNFLLSVLSREIRKRELHLEQRLRGRDQKKQPKSLPDSEECCDPREQISRLRSMGETFSQLPAQEIKRRLGNDFELVWEFVLTARALQDEMEKSGFSLEEIFALIQRDGLEALPVAARDTLQFFYDQVDEQSLLVIARVVSSNQLSNGEKVVLGARLADLKKTLSCWQEAPREPIKKQIEIRGIPSDFEENFQKAMERVFPDGESNTVQAIEYVNQVCPAMPEYGVTGYINAVFFPDGLKIIFYRPPEDYPSFFRSPREIAALLAHEYGHSLDPTLVAQPGMSRAEQLGLVLRWRNVREQTGDVFAWEEMINPPNPAKREIYKDREAFAETVACFFENPLFLAIHFPARFEFMYDLFNTRNLQLPERVEDLLRSPLKRLIFARLSPEARKKLFSRD